MEWQWYLDMQENNKKENNEDMYWLQWYREQIMEISKQIEDEQILMKIYTVSITHLKILKENGD